MQIAVSSPEILRVLPRVLDEMRRMSIAVMDVRATPATGMLRVDLEPGGADRPLLDTLVARITGMMGVATVSIDECAPCARLSPSAAQTTVGVAGRSVDG
jgi:hypothetical protein